MLIVKFSSEYKYLSETIFSKIKTYFTFKEYRINLLIDQNESFEYIKLQPTQLQN